VYSYNIVSYSNTKEHTTDAHKNVNESQKKKKKYAYRKKPEAKIK